MANYEIDFFDPLRTPISLAPGGLNGPGTTPSKSAIYFHGRGYLDWGENVNENFLFLMENFAGATPPLNPIQGQTWYQVLLYVHNTTDNTWFRWNYSTGLWDLLSPIIITESTTEPYNPAEGTYWYHPTTEVLKRWDSQYTPRGAPQWVERRYQNDVADPLPGTRPGTMLSAWNGSQWNTVGGVTSQNTAPTGVQTGQMWFDPSTETLYVYDALTTPKWTAILLANGHSPVVGHLDANNNRVIGVLTDIFDLTSAVTLETMENYITTELSSGLMVDIQSHINDEALHLTANEDAWLDGITATVDEVNNLQNIARNVQDQIDDLNAANTISLAGKVSITGDTMTGLLLAPTVNPVNSNHAVTKGWIDNIRDVFQLRDVTWINPAAANYGYQNGDILRYNSANQMWEPVATAGTLWVYTNRTPGNRTLPAGGSMTITVLVVNANGTETDVSSLATFQILSGTGTLAGNQFTGPTSTTQTTTTIRVSYSTYAAKTIGIITEPQVTISAVNVYGPDTITHDVTAKFYATATLSNGDVLYSTDANQASMFTWKRDGVSIPSPTFVVTSSIPAGAHNVSTTVTIPNETKTGTKSWTVVSVPRSLAITGSLSTMLPGATRDFDAIVTMSDNSTKTVEPVWRMVSGVGTISATGVYTSPTFVSADTSVTIRALYTEAGITVTSPNVSFTVQAS